MCENIFLAVCQGVKKRVFEKKMCTFCFCLFYVGKRKRENMKKMEKENFKKKTRKIVFFGWLWRKMFFFVKLSFFRKIGKHYLCSEGKKKCAFSLQLSVFGKCHFFWCPLKVTKHYKNRGFSGHRGKPKMALLVAKVPFWVFPRKGVLLSVMPESCVSLKTLFL